MWWRITAVFALFCTFFFFISLRLFYWQIISSDRLKRQAFDQYALTLRLPAARGSILASDGSELVINQPAYLVYAEPRNVEDKGRFSREVSEILTLDEKELILQLSEPNRVWVPLAKKVDMEVVEKLKALKLTGLGFEREPKRYYPEASMSAQLLGFVGSDQNGNDKGYFGLEGYYDRELRGKDGSIFVEKDVRGSPILIGEEKRIEAENGRSLVLWIDKSIQRIVEDKLAAGIAKYGAKEGSVVVMDPKTGGILAMASYPSYDPMTFATFDKSLYPNPIVAGSYEPGSTFKVLIMGAGVEEKVVTPNTTMEETGPVTVGPYAIRTWNNQYNGTVTMTDVLLHSSNVGMVFVQRKLGEKEFVRYIHDFGFGKPTDVDLEDEQSPDLRGDDEWKEIDLATASFGQGIAVTPIQMVRAVSAYANDGWLMEPKLVKEIRDSKGRVLPIPPKRLRQVVSPATAKIMTEMMVVAVEQGEAKWAKPKGYRIAGKTGTAQIPVAGHYDATKTIASFVGIAPADNPRFVMLVTLREPTSSPWGSETAAPLYFAIAQGIFSYLNISPEQ